MSRLDEIDREVSVHALDPQWKDRIEGAPSESELIALARKYLVSRPPEILARLPGMPPTRRIAGPNDVSLLTFRLRRLYCSPILEADHVKAVECLLAFFEAVSERMFLLRTQAEGRERHLPSRMSASG